MSLKMKSKLILLGLLPCFVMVSIILFLVSTRMKAVVTDDMTILRETLLEAKKVELSHLLDSALSSIKSYTEASGATEEDKTNAIARLKELKYGKDGYFFGYDGNSVRIFSGSDSAKVGESFRDYRDVNGVYLINDLVKQGQAGGGYVTYYFPRLGQGDAAYPKLSYAMWLPKWNLMIGTGFYIDDIDKAVIQAQALSEKHIQKTLMMIFLTTGAVLVCVLLAALATAHNTIKPIDELASSLRNIASGGGDLTRRLVKVNDDEVGEVTSAFNVFVDSIQIMVKHIHDLTHELGVVTQSVSKDTTITFNTLDLQRGQTLQVASAINEMAASSQEVARSTHEAANAGNSAEHSTKEAQVTASHSIKHINELSAEVKLNTDGLQRLQTDVHGIGAVSDVIRGIAEQTNLLALNASIEAARAGEQGRGFAVVADEVRALAARTQSSTQEIQEMIQRLQASTTAVSESIKRSLIKGETSVQMVLATSEALRAIDAQVSTINGRGVQIATAANEQTQAIESINQNMHQIADATETASDSASRSHVSVAELVSIGAELQQLVKQFKI